MKKNNIKNLVCIILVFVSSSLCLAGLSRDEKLSLFEQANEAFRQANSITDDHQQQQQAYTEAILIYEKLINDGSVRNAKLYYNLANAYLLRSDVGLAILNYRRALELDGSDTNINKNLAFARSRAIDKFKLKTSHELLKTLFFWHYDFAIKTRFTIAVLCFAIVFIAASILIWFGRKSRLTISLIISLLIGICFAGSVFVENSNSQLQGVITAKSVIARQGDSLTYPQSFEQPLHEGTEFELIEHRLGWLHLTLADRSDCWIPENSAQIIQN